MAATKKRPRTRKPAKPRAAKPRTRRPRTPDLDPDQQTQALKEIKRANTEVDQTARKVLDATQQYERAKEILKGEKGEHAKAVEAMQKVVHKWTGPEEPNLFQPLANAKPAPSANGAAPQPAAASTATAADEWRKENLSVLIPLGGLTQSKLDKFNAIDLNTVGDLSDWLKGPPLRNYVDLPGIGKGWVEKLENAMEKFWSERGHPLQQVATHGPAELVNPDGTTQVIDAIHEPAGEVIDAEFEVTDDAGEE